MLEQTSAGSAGLAPGKWLVDSRSGSVGFKVKTMWGLVDVKGAFEKFEGQLEVDDSGISGELVVHTDSLNTKNKKRDEHLRSADFFDAKSHPRVVFTASEASARPSGVTFAGEIALGHTRTSVEIPATVEPAGSNGAITVRADVEIPREDLGLVWNKMGMIKGHARVSVELHLTQSN